MLCFFAAFSAERLRCSQWGSRNTDFVVTGDGGHRVPNHPDAQPP
jgi:hypothetical protein